MPRDAVSWADVALVWRAVLRLAGSNASSLRPAIRPWPTQLASDKAGGVPSDMSGGATSHMPRDRRTDNVAAATERVSVPEKELVLETAPDRVAPVSERVPESTPASDAALVEPPATSPEYDAANERTKPLRAKRVPATRLGRLLHYGSLGAGLAWGSASEYMRQTTRGSGGSSLFLSAANVERLVDKLSTMRGAALKLGQFLSIQDSHLLPPQVEEVLLRVQNAAHYMPGWQLERVMTEELGEHWRAHFASFDERPFAAASIGQVHSAVMADPYPAQPEMAGRRVAVKVQFPGIRDSIASDLSYVKWLLTASALLPKGLFLENSVQQLQQELQDECDYTREADMCRRFYQHVAHMEPHGLRFEVPRVVDSVSTTRVLTAEFLRGRPLTQALARKLAQGPGVTLICGRFEGVDQRVLDAHAVEEISIGDYVLTGGEIAAQVLIDATVRLIPRVLGNQDSLAEESFSHGLLEHPQYTKPAIWEGRATPDVLLSGNHAAISQWRALQAESLTKERRPDLWRAYAERHVDPAKDRQLSGASDQSRNSREHDKDPSR